MPRPSGVGRARNQDSETMERNEEIEVEFRSGRPRGLEHTWSANVWSTFQRQKLSMGVARLQAEGINKKISQNLPVGAQFYKTAA